MDNGEFNCALGVCCCEENCADKRRRALASIITKGIGDGPFTAAQMADFILNTFDLAEKGTLEPLFRSIAALARGKDYEG